MPTGPSASSLLAAFPPTAGGGDDPARQQNGWTAQVDELIHVTKEQALGFKWMCGGAARYYHVRSSVLSGAVIVINAVAGVTGFNEQNFPSAAKSIVMAVAAINLVLAIVGGLSSLLDYRGKHTAFKTHTIAFSAMVTRINTELLRPRADRENGYQFALSVVQDYDKASGEVGVALIPRSIRAEYLKAYRGKRRLPDFFLEEGLDEEALATMIPPPNPRADMHVQRSMMIESMHRSHSEGNSAASSEHSPPDTERHNDAVRAAAYLMQHGGATTPASTAERTTPRPPEAPLRHAQRPHRPPQRPPDAEADRL